jgi:hypothetical protein
MINYRKEFRKAQQLAKRKTDMSGKGNYLFENNTKGDFHLPRPTSEGVRMVKFGGQFAGDDYYFSMLKTGELKLVRNLSDQPSPEKLFVYKNYNRDETKLPEANRDGQWIIPPTGEFVGDSRYFPLLKTGRLKLLKEVEQQMPQPQKLLTEQPPVVSHQGHVEFVKVDAQQLNEEEKKKKDKLLSEDPLSGVKLLLD